MAHSLHKGRAAVHTFRPPACQRSLGSSLTLFFVTLSSHTHTHTHLSRLELVPCSDTAQSLQPSDTQRAGLRITCSAGPLLGLGPTVAHADHFFYVACEYLCVTQ